MSSQGTGADISRQEANDLLHRLITESIKVQAAFSGRGSVMAVVRGFVTRQHDGIVQVTEGRQPDDPALSFGTADVSAFKYGDNRAFPPRPLPGPRLISALCFVYPDGAQAALFELEAIP